MLDIEELLERLYKENKITYEEYSAIKARLGHLTLVIESYIQAVTEAEEIIAELKAHCKAVDEVNEKMKHCKNCKHYGTVCPECCRIDPDTHRDGWELA